MGIKKPGHTQTPNDLFDDWLPNMSNTELRVTLVVIRQTLGWHKEADSISLTQFQQMTGLSRQGVISGIAAAIERGTITEAGTGVRGVKLYKPVYEDDATSQPSRPDEAEKHSEPDPIVEQTSQLSRPVDDATSQLSRPDEAVTSQLSRHTKETTTKESNNLKKRKDDESIIILPSPMYDKPIGPEPLAIPEVPQDQPDQAEVFRAIHQKLGWMMSKTLADDIEDTIHEFGKDLVLQAINQSEKHHPGSWNYIRTVIHSLKDKRDGAHLSPAVTPPPKRDYVDWSQFKRKESA